MSAPREAHPAFGRLHRIEELFHSARERPPAERRSFLVAACDGDDTLRAEVEALLDHADGSLLHDGLSAVVGRVAAPGALEGRTIGPYALGALLGAGGMNEVYRARDTKLGRDVAVKILPETLVTNRDRLARFEREARILAALNHPNIAHLYSVENADGIVALVMELVEGPTLADRIAKGPIPLNESLAIADQIAEGLEAAHAQGIVHRDLKPANIKVRADGTVKILDFGVAKALEPSGGPAASVLDSPTMSSPSVRTGVGVLIGTVLYMSPEQLKGEPADRKSDVWAFGCVLFEMLTAQSAFAGTDVAAVTASVVRDTPDWSKLPAAAPLIQSLLAGCLEKNPFQRIADIAVARFAIKELVRQPASASPIFGAAGSSRRPWLPWAIAIAGMLVAAIAVGVPRRPQAASSAPIRLTAQLEPGVAIRAARGSDIAISRDGTQIAVAAFTDRGSQLFVRRLDQPSFIAVPGTIGARIPFFSPDGKWIGYIAEPNLYRVAASGGVPMTICELRGAGGGGAMGASWADDDRIVIGATSGNTGLSWVASNGGTVTSLAKGSGDSSIWSQWPQVLPGGRSVIYTVLNGLKPPDIFVAELPSGTPRLLMKNAFYGRYAATGHLVFARGNTLYAAAFDPTRLALMGEPVPIVEGVSANTGTAFMNAQYAVSDDGTIVYTTGGAAAAQDRAPLVLLGRDGVRSTWLQGVSSIAPSFSRDGNQLAFAGAEPNKAADIMIYDRRMERFRGLTLDPANDYASPVWSPDGRKIAFAARPKGNTPPARFNMYWRNADGSGGIHRLTAADAHQFPGGWHPSGNWIVYQEIKATGTGDILALPLERDGADGLNPGTPQPIAATPANERVPAFSADGRWIAYTSIQNGTGEVLVRPFQGADGPWQVSQNGGNDPVWNPVKNELLFRSLVGLQIMTAEYSISGRTLRFGRPRPWPGAVLAAGENRRWTMAPDGDHIAGGLVDPMAEQSVTVALHLLEGVKPTSPR
jgi:serine/threonine-protein kinase